MCGRITRGGNTTFVCFFEFTHTESFFAPMASSKVIQTKLSKQSYSNKRKCLHNNRVQPLAGFFGCTNMTRVTVLGHQCDCDSKAARNKYEMVT